MGEESGLGWWFGVSLEALSVRRLGRGTVRWLKWRITPGPKGRLPPRVQIIEMSYFPGVSGSLSFRSNELVWETRDGGSQGVDWSAIRSVTTGNEGATVLSDGPPLLIPNDIVWFEFVVEDIIGKARKANPNYDGPLPVQKPRDLRIPRAADEQLYYTRRAQRFYKDRCPSYHEFKAFLEANLDWEFVEDSYYECSMSMCSGSPVDEGHSTDLVIPTSEAWYRKFEKSVRSGRYTGGELLIALKAVEPR